MSYSYRITLKETRIVETVIQSDSSDSGDALVGVDSESLLKNPKGLASIDVSILKVEPVDVVGRLRLSGVPSVSEN